LSSDPRAKGLLIAVVAMMLCLAASTLRSLPMFRSLYGSRAGYKPHCSVCHVPADNRLTPYAREFQRLGGGAAALESLDVMDPDEDGSSSKDEIDFHSNPGDPRSTPEHPGDWLSRVTVAPPPRKLLSKLFGKDATYEVLERQLSPAQVRDAEMFLGEKLRDEERFPVIFLVRKWLPALGNEKKGDQALWRAAYTYYGKESYTVFLVVLGQSDVLRAVIPVSLKGDQRLGSGKFLKQFEGKNSAALQSVASPVDAEAETAKLLDAVKRAIKIVELAAPAVSGEGE
jgi:hypothetical protein